jgi:hypothetical protein
MKIVFRKFRWIFKLDWYSLCRFKDHGIIDIGMISIILNKRSNYE